MNIIEKESKTKEHFSYARRYTKSARAALAHILECVDLQEQPLLLPAYIGLSKVEGSGVMDPVRETHSRYEFYRLDKNLSPDIQHIELLIKEKKCKAIFIIHYFGFCQTSIEELITVCKKNNVYVIEDCAHTILGGMGKNSLLGSYGDSAIFSIHKSTPTLDGGFFIDNSGLLANSILRDDRRISQSTLEIFSNVDLRKICKKRIENFNFLLEELKDIAIIKPIFSQLNQKWETTPLNFPVIISMGLREKLYFNLCEKKIMTTALYHTLIPEITSEKFPISHFVSQNILNLPIHQEVEQKDLKLLVREIKIFEEKYKKGELDVL